MWFFKKSFHLEGTYVTLTHISLATASLMVYLPQSVPKGRTEVSDGQHCGYPSQRHCPPSLPTSLPPHWCIHTAFFVLSSPPPRSWGALDLALESTRFYSATGAPLALSGSQSWAGIAGVPGKGSLCLSLGWKHHTKTENSPNPLPGPGLSPAALAAFVTIRQSLGPKWKPRL